MKQTQLFSLHKKLNAKMIPFGPWQMPVSYTSIIEEHKHVRKACGLFDVSHMGEIWVEGKDAKDLLLNTLINDIEKLEPGKGQYTALTNAEGGIIDDLIAYQLSESTYLLCVNASNIGKDFDWLRKHSEELNCQVLNRSDEFSQIAVQGPESLRVIERVFPHLSEIALIPYMGIVPTCDGIYIARTGYTGEHGYEIYLPNQEVVTVWESLMAQQESRPIGLGARDTLRLEACYLLYGQDMDESVNPLEAGISWAMKLNHPFAGSDVLSQVKQAGPSRKIVAFTMEDKGIPRQGMDVFFKGEHVGRVTSGSFLPSLEVAGGLALINSELSEIGTELTIDIRGKSKLAQVRKRPLYSVRTK